MSGKGEVMLSIRQTGGFNVTCPMGLAGHFVTPDGMRSAFIASKEEGHRSLNAALRRGRFNEVMVRGMRAGLDASTLADRIEETAPMIRRMVMLLNIEGVLSVGLYGDGTNFVVCETSVSDSVAREVNRVREWRVDFDELRALAEDEGFDIALDGGFSVPNNMVC